MSHYLLFTLHFEVWLTKVYKKIIRGSFVEFVEGEVMWTGVVVLDLKADVFNQARLPFPGLFVHQQRPEYARWVLIG